jgi:hypothetical protein
MDGLSKLLTPEMETTYLEQELLHVTELVVSHQETPQEPEEVLSGMDREEPEPLLGSLAVDLVTSEEMVLPESSSSQSTSPSVYSQKQAHRL